MFRRLPVYILLDIGSNMKGKLIEIARLNIKQIIESSVSESFLLETAWLSLITVGYSINQIYPLTELVFYCEERNAFFNKLNNIQPDIGEANTTGLNEYIAYRFKRDHINTSYFTDAGSRAFPPRVLWFSDRSHIEFEKQTEERNKLWRLWNTDFDNPLFFMVVDCSTNINCEQIVRYLRMRVGTLPPENYEEESKHEAYVVQIEFP